MRVLTTIDVDVINSCRELGEFLWIDLVAPNPQQLERLGDVLRWNPLLTEDLQHGGQRPKIEDFSDHTLVVCYGST